jgi:hypothetical protein
MAKIGYGYDRLQVLNLVRRCTLLGKEGKLKNFKVSSGYLERLMGRFPQLAIRKVQAFDRLRAIVDETQVNIFFDVLSEGFEALNEITKKVSIANYQIFNVDECGFNLGRNSGFILSEKGSKSCYLVDNTNIPHISVVACVSANGLCLNPLFLLKGKRKRLVFEENLKKTHLSNSYVCMTDKAYITKESFLIWAEIFVEYLKDSQINGAILIMDNHTSHTLNLDALEFLNKNNVFCISLPAHSSHILQPLDVACFRPLKQSFRDMQMEYQRDIKKIIDQDDFPHLIAPAWIKAFSSMNICAGI